VAISLFAINRPASASGVFIAAASTADAGLNACSSNQGKALYGCVANVLDRMSSDISSVNEPAAATTRAALQTAASRLRAATTKSQALSAISQCQAAIAGALRQVRTTAGGKEGAGSGLAAVAGVLAHAARLIQAKG